MKKKMILSVISFAAVYALMAEAQAQWVSVSQSLPESAVRYAAVDGKNSREIYATSSRKVYRSHDAGGSWKRVWSLRGTDSEITGLCLHSERAGTIFVSTTRGVDFSKESGKNWKALYRGIGESSRAVYSLAVDRREPNKLWIGSTDGLSVIDIDSGIVQKVQGLPNVTVRSILLSKEFPNNLIVVSDEGIYKSSDHGEHWQKVSSGLMAGSDENNLSSSTDLQQFNIEEMRLAPPVSNAIFLPAKNRYYSATQKGILEASLQAENWAPLSGENLPDHKINYLTASSQTFYAATDHGVFQRDTAKENLRDVSDGLVSKKVNSLFYAASSDTLFASTEQGLYRWTHPDFDPTKPKEGGVLVEEAEASHQAKKLLTTFSNEPSIREIQTVAIHYAEVHPKKIEAWRAAAAKKAWFPTLSMNRSFSEDQNIDIDRGGTGDPDKFIYGPDEGATDWSVGASWNLGELVWNDDQTSIDTRSRLLVELRDDVLTEVTHLYFERRRLQMEMLLSPNKDLPLQVEKQLKLEELTAGIDALTGGYLSERLAH